MVHRCAWCGSTIRITDDTCDRDGVSHGVCLDCEKRLNAELDKLQTTGSDHGPQTEDY